MWSPPRARRACSCTRAPVTWTAATAISLMLGPPFVITDDELDLVVERTAAAIATIGPTWAVRAGLVLCPEAHIYDHGLEHPLRPQRVLYTWQLIIACGLTEPPSVSTFACREASDAEIGLVHTAEYIDATRRAGHGEPGPWGRFGYGPGDNPIFPNMHEAGALVAGASLVAARAVHEGHVAHAFNAAGGLHHAMPARASGFCVYDDPAIAIAWLLQAGVERIAYVDVDVHHGDGVQAIFYEDPRVLTISIHQSGETLFPGTGFDRRARRRRGEGTAVNIPLQPYTTDEAWLAAFRELVPPIVRAFAPAGARDAARMRHARDGSARSAAAHDARLPRDVADAPRARSRGVRRPLGRDRWRRVPVGAGRSPSMDALRSPRCATHSSPTPCPGPGSRPSSARPAARSRPRSRSHRRIGTGSTPAPRRRSSSSGEPASRSSVSMREVTLGARPQPYAVLPGELDERLDRSSRPPRSRLVPLRLGDVARVLAPMRVRERSEVRASDLVALQRHRQLVGDLDLAWSVVVVDDDREGVARALAGLGEDRLAHPERSPLASHRHDRAAVGDAVERGGHGDPALAAEHRDDLRWDLDEMAAAAPAGADLRTERRLRHPASLRGRRIPPGRSQRTRSTGDPADAPSVQGRGQDAERLEEPGSRAGSRPPAPGLAARRRR